MRIQYRIMTNIIAEGQEPVNYINSIDSALWCLRDFLGPQFSHITSNMVEQMNDLLKFSRELSTLALLDEIWSRHTHN